MSKVIKVEDHIYDQLDELRGKGETFSQVIERMLTVRSSIFSMLSVVERQLQFREWQSQKLQELETVYR